MKATTSKVFFGFIVIFLVLLLAARIALPYLLINYVEAQLNNIPEYKAKIADIDVHLYRGSYVIKKLQLWKINNHIPVPFFSSELIDLSIEWRAILRGKLVGKITLMQPAINFVSAPNSRNEQLSINDQWLTIVKHLFPLNINKVDVRNGTISLRSYSGKPPFNIYLKAVNLEIKNMQNVTRSPALLSSTLEIKANSMDGGQLTTKGKFSPFANEPTFAMDLTLTGVQVKSLANFLKHFTLVDVKSGKFNLYVELTAGKGKIKGYAKPFIKDLKVGTPSSDNPIEYLFDGAAALFSKVLKNPQQQTIATKITIQGDIDDPDTSILSIIGYILRHAFLKALLPQIDHNIQMQEVIQYPRKAADHKK